MLQPKSSSAHFELHLKDWGLVPWKLTCIFPPRCRLPKSLDIQPLIHLRILLPGGSTASSDETRSEISHCCPISSIIGVVPAYEYHFLFQHWRRHHSFLRTLHVLLSPSKFISRPRITTKPRHPQLRSAPSAVNAGPDTPPGKQKRRDSRVLGLWRSTAVSHRQDRLGLS